MNKLGKPVTIAIGILCNDSIQLASDSQTTRGNVKSMTAAKLSLIEMDHCAKILVAQAGHVDHASNVLQSLERLAEGKQLTDVRTFADLMQDACLEVRNEIRRQRFNCSAKELQDYLWEHEMDCRLMAAHYFEGVPYIYEISLSQGVASKVAGGNGSEYFTAMGTGANLALYLLEESAKPDMLFNPSFALLTYTVGEVKKHDTYCAGQTRFGWIDAKNDGALLDQEAVNKVAEGLERYNQQTQKRRNAELTEMLESVAKEYAAKHGF